MPLSNILSKALAISITQYKGKMYFIIGLSYFICSDMDMEGRQTNQ